ncbi:hypothetical protein [Leptospira kmetyi]|uniref:hypothetical protein n=1 Tax=Leptospira kmetyi TaxID=408139 RepID=UPI0010845DAC|nr:hypothetical protein [Leptospira kmetyi]TGL69746.1 hypothetical protein EHQ67_08850 [Leptospira kmetyi]
MAAKKKQSRLKKSDFEIKIHESAEFVNNRVDKHKSSANKASYALTSMVVAGFGAFWGHFKNTNENQANEKFLKITDEIIELDKQLVNSSKNLNPDSDVKDIAKNESLKLELIHKKETLNEILLLYKENPFLLEKGKPDTFYHFHIILILVSIWVLIGILFTAYKYHMKEMARYDNLRLFYDRLALIYKLKELDYREIIYKMLKNPELFNKYEKPEEMNLFLGLLQKIFKWK